MRKCHQTTDREMVQKGLALRLKKDTCHLEKEKKTSLGFRKTVLSAGMSQVSFKEKKSQCPGPNQIATCSNKKRLR